LWFQLGIMTDAKSFFLARLSKIGYYLADKFCLPMLSKVVS
jgi:hypothetical protein